VRFEDAINRSEERKLPCRGQLFNLFQPPQDFTAWLSLRIAAARSEKLIHADIERLSETHSHLSRETPIAAFHGRNDGLNDSDLLGQLYLRQGALFANPGDALSERFAAEIDGGQIKTGDLGHRSQCNAG